MTKISVPGIIAIVVMIIIVITFVILTFVYRARFQQCSTNESPYCFQFVCGKGHGNNTCGIYPRRPGPDPNTWYCMQAPLTLVNNAGTPVT